MLDWGTINSVGLTLPIISNASRPGLRRYATASIVGLLCSTARPLPPLSPLQPPSKLPTQPRTFANRRAFTGRNGNWMELVQAIMPLSSPEQKPCRKVTTGWADSSSPSFSPAFSAGGREDRNHGGGGDKIYAGRRLASSFILCHHLVTLSLPAVSICHDSKRNILPEQLSEQT